MTVERRIANWFKMDESAWARHASPWSVWSRFSCLPLLSLAIWSRMWIGGESLVPVAFALWWIWMNPRLFSPPKSTDNWASKGTFGERVWMNRDTIPVPEHHRDMPNILSVVSLIGLSILIWGLVVLHIWATVMGLAIVTLSKLWFVDRMVLLYEEMKDKNPTYRHWLY